MPAAIAYKSFCWNFGTTSFRTKNFNKTIEEQIELLHGFWQLPENQNCSWQGNDELQSRYYDYMQRMGFVKGNANNKPKDAREKTSGLEDIGLIDSGRRLTQAGLSLLDICNSKDFSPDNFFEIPKDSYIYLKQLLKMSTSIDGNTVRPFIVLLYVLSKVEKLSLDEFTYLLPLCTSKESTQRVVDGILKGISKTETIDSLILERLMSMDNYQAALAHFCNNNVDEKLVCTIGFNRKGKKYDKVYFPLYQQLYSAYVDKNTKAFLEIFTATRKINIGKRWRTYLFKTSFFRAIKKNPLNCLNHTIFDSVTNEHEFKIAFFKIMHLFKAKATLLDYFDLNRRYIKITDIVLFEDGIVQLDIVPKYFFKSIIDNLYEQAYAKTPELYNDCAINKIAPCLNVDEQAVIKSVNAELGTTVTTVAEARNVLEDNRYTRFKHLIDTKFSDEQILILLDYFKSRKDSDITKMVTNNADIPTIFEYVLGILWYKISEFQGRILDYMKLSLDADLLPKTHAAGGEADIVYEYGETECYPSHSLLIEATLADQTNQRRMEMEPVSRHLGQHLIRTQNPNSYCIFATTFLDRNVTSDFRGRKNMPYYDSQDTEKYIEGMKIIPLEISELKRIIQTSKTYKELYPIFDQAFNTDLPPHLWYKSCIQDSLNN